MRVCLGGTFHPFHAGHAALLNKAAEVATEMFVGVTQGTLAQRPGRTVAPVEERIASVEAHLQSAGYPGAATVRELTDAAGPSATGEYDAIVVSPETIAGAHAINATRTANGLPALQIITVEHVMAEDGLPISATRIAAADIDAEGKRLVPVRIAVGSQNPVKVAAVEQELSALLGLEVNVQGQDVPSGVPEQPRDDQTMRGAAQRAEAAMAAWPADYAIGVEAGLQGHGSAWFDVQACAILDCLGGQTQGWGPGFQYPNWVNKRALAGEMISDILGPVAGDPRIGGTTGAIGYLSDGAMDRTELTRIAIRMAWIPRIRPGLYGKEGEGESA